MAFDMIDEREIAVNMGTIKEKFGKMKRDGTPGEQTWNAAVYETLNFTRGEMPKNYKPPEGYEYNEYSV